MEEREQPLANATKHRMAAIAGVIAFVKSDDELDEEELDEALDEALDEDEEPDQEEDKCKDKESGPSAAKRQSRWMLGNLNAVPPEHSPDDVTVNIMPANINHCQTQEADVSNLWPHWERLNPPPTAPK